MPKLIVGLGNPGKEYEKTRHNVGFFIVDRLAEEWGADFRRQKFHGHYAEHREGDEKILLVKPETFMNLSGRCVGPWVDFLKLEGGDLLVVHDELDLPFGRMKAQFSASAAGQKGVASIIEALGHKDFCRLRVGIGRPPAQRGGADHVLAAFSKEERKILDEELLPKASEAVKIFVKMGLDPLMQMVNTRRPN
ncbi:MAG: aminoacyl-tRNA hydrolase [Deltaproteobacteria bacterium]|nr:aminoacyl-tRNA hydrolase [Deltaproteobacteria bacterium]